MEDDETVYVNSCKSNGVDLEAHVKQAFKESSVTGEFNIASHTVSIKTCEIIGDILKKSHNITKLNISDCLLPPQGLLPILNSIQASTRLQRVNLHGNNIGEESCDKLSYLLATNRHIRELTLKWNNLGTSVEGFMTLCDGIAKNEGIQVLDLRCNQMCPLGAKYLAKALSINKTIRELDLRWNQIESEGAEYLLEALETNKHVTIIKLDGNFVRKELVSSIEQCLKCNSSVNKLTVDWESRTKLLSKHIKSLEQLRMTEVSNLNEQTKGRIEEAESKLLEITREFSEKVLKIKQLEEQLMGTESSLKLENHKNKALEEALKERDKTYKELSDNNFSTIENLKKMIHEKDLEFMRVKNDLEDKMKKERDLRISLESELELLKESSSHEKAKFTRLQEKMDSAIKQQTELLEEERNMWHQRYLDLERSSEANLERVRASALDRTQSLENTIMELSEKQSDRITLFSERLERAKEEKILLESQLSSALSSISILKSENENLKEQAKEPLKRISALEEEVANEKSYNQKLKQERLNEVRNSDELSKEIGRLRTEYQNYRQNQSEIEEKHAEQMKHLKLKIKQLQFKLSEKEKRINSYRSEERDRAKALHSAFSKYIATIPPKSPDNSELT